MGKNLFVGFHHYAVRSPDLTRSIEFYEELGFHIVHEWKLREYGIDRAIMMQAPDAQSWIELFDMKAAIPMQGSPAQNDEPVATGALAHICLTVTDLGLASAHMVSAGARRLQGPQKLSLGAPPVHAENSIFEGPAGEVIELLKQVRFPRDLRA